MHVAFGEARRPQLDTLRVSVVKVLRGMAQQAAAVRRVAEPRLRLLDARALILGLDRADLRADRLLARGPAVGIASSITAVMVSTLLAPR